MEVSRSKSKYVWVWNNFKKDLAANLVQFLLANICYVFGLNTLVFL